jgi:hypothetical protein
MITTPTPTAVRTHHQPRSKLTHKAMPALLDAGLDEESATELRLGLLPVNDAIDTTGIGRRLGAIQQLRRDNRLVVNRWADEAARDLYALFSLLQGRGTGSSRLPSEP